MWICVGKAGDWLAAEHLQMQPVYTAPVCVCMASRTECGYPWELRTEPIHEDCMEGQGLWLAPGINLFMCVLFNQTKLDLKKEKEFSVSHLPLPLSAVTSA